MRYGKRILSMECVERFYHARHHLTENTTSRAHSIRAHKNEKRDTRTICSNKKVAPIANRVEIEKERKRKVLLDDEELNEALAPKTS